MLAQGRRGKSCEWPTHSPRGAESQNALKYTICTQFHSKSVKHDRNPLSGRCHAACGKAKRTKSITERAHTIAGAPGNRGSRPGSSGASWESVGVDAGAAGDRNRSKTTNLTLIFRPSSTLGGSYCKSFHDSDSWQVCYGNQYGTRFCKYIGIPSYWGGGSLHT